MRMELIALILIAGAGLLAFPKQAGAALTSIGLPKISPKTPINSHDLDILARTIWGEARGEGYSGMQAVANVIMNRYQQAQASTAKARQFGETVAEICKKPYQFSVWNITDPNREKAENVTTSDPLFRQALDIAEKALSGTLVDITGGADHYHTASINPYWSEGLSPSAVVGNHLFFNV